MLPELEDSLNGPIVSLIALAKRAIKAQNLQTVGVLASPNSIQSQLFARLTESTVVIVPDDTRLAGLSTVIHGVIAGEINQAQALQTEIRHLEAAGADMVLLGCSELSVINHTARFTNVIDPLTLAVDEIMKNNV